MGDAFRRILGQLEGRRRHAYGHKGCTAKGMAPTPCAGDIVRAHSVSKSSTLKPMSRNRHVVEHRERLDMERAPFVSFSFEEIGVGRASVFHGFCARHDRDLFSCIETETFAARPDQCFALAYRAVAHELHGQVGRTQIQAERRELMRREDLVRSDAVMDAAASRERAAKDGILLMAARTAAMIRASDTGGIEHLVLAYDGVLPIAFSGTFAPMWDLQGRRLQSMRPSRAPGVYLVVNTVGSPGRTHVVLSWLTDTAAPLRPLLDDLTSWPVEVAGYAALELAMEGVGNVFFAPDWIEGLSAPSGEALKRLLVHGATYAPGPTPWAQLHRGLGVPTATSRQRVA